LSLRSALQYPFNHATLTRKRIALRNELLRQEGLREVKVALLGGSTTAELRAQLELFLLNEGLRPIFHESEYGKY
jgi:hypothetical protein